MLCFDLHNSFYNFVVDFLFVLSLGANANGKTKLKA